MSLKRLVFPHAIAALLLTVAPAEALSLAEALDQPAWTVTTGGDKPWVTETSVTHDGVDAAVSGPIGDYERSWLETSLTLAERSQLTFWWKVSSEDDYDLLSLQVDGWPTLEIGGERDWERVSRILLPGVHTLRWEYREYGSSNSDRAWVDAVAIEAAFPGSVSAALAEAVDQPSWTFTTGDDVPWSSQDTTTWDGVDAAQAGSDLGGNVSWFQTTREFASDGVVAFRWKFTPGAGNALLFLVDGVPAAHIEEFQVDWAPVTWGITAGTHTLSWEYQCSVWGEGSAWVDVVEFIPADASVTLAEALDQPTWQFISGGNNLWQGETARTHDGSDAAESGPIRNGEVTWFETTREFASSGTLEFWWKVSSFNAYLRFLVDGVPVFEEVDIAGWEQFSWVLQAGTHTLRWEYDKEDSSWLNSADAAWIDEVNFTPAATVYRRLTVRTNEENNWAGVFPRDANGLDGGDTPLSLLYPDGTEAVIEVDEWGRHDTGLAGWTGCDSFEGTTCRVTLSSDREVIARYYPAPVGQLYDLVGGPGQDAGRCIARGADGGILVAGELYDAGVKAWLASFASDGTPLWQVTSPGRGADVAAAPDGSVYLTGTAGSKLFLRKHASEGTALWTRTSAGAGNGVAVSPDGTAVYVTGVSGGDLLVRKYTAAGQLVWTRKVAGSAGRVDEGKRVAVAADGSVFVVGYLQRTGKGKSAWIRKYSPAGGTLWTLMQDGAGKGNDWAGGLALAGDTLFVTGSVRLAVGQWLWTAAFGLDGVARWSEAWGYPYDPEVTVEGSGVALSPAGTVDFLATIRIPMDESWLGLARLRPDGTRADWDIRSLDFEPAFEAASAGGIVAGEDGCYITGSAWNWRTESLDILVAKYGYGVSADSAAPALRRFGRLQLAD